MELMLLYIVLVWIASAVVAAGLFAFSLLTRPAAPGLELRDPEGAKLHFWASELEVAEAKRASQIRMEEAPELHELIFQEAA